MKKILALLLIISLIAFGCSKKEEAKQETTDSTEEFSVPMPDVATMTMVTTESGLKYHDVVVGDGEMPKQGQKIEAHYAGWFLDGKMFDTSLNGSVPFKYVHGVSKLIKGWDEGVSSMRVGGKRIIVVPPELGYGDKDRGPIPANSTLVFQIELLSAGDQGSATQSKGSTMSSMPDINKLALKDGPEGLKYFDTVEGSGDSPQSGMSVIVHYTGWLTNGEKFDSSKDRNETFNFPLGQHRVIRGWDLGVATMKKGGTRILVIPSELGYGARGVGPIPPNATLVFEVELIDFK